MSLRDCKTIRRLTQKYAQKYKAYIDPKYAHEILWTIIRSNHPELFDQKKNGYWKSNLRQLARCLNDLFENQKEPSSPLLASSNKRQYYGGPFPIEEYTTFKITRLRDEVS